MTALQTFLVTRSVEHEMIIWDINNSNEQGDIDPQEVKKFDEVSCFELKIINNELVLSFQKEKQLLQYVLKPGQISEESKQVIELEDLHCQLIYICEDDSILISDKDDNVYRLTLNDKKDLQSKLLREKTLNAKVMGLHFHYDISTTNDDQEVKKSIVTAVISNNQDKNTILATIDLDLLLVEEAEELKREEEKQKKKEQEEEKKNSMSEDEFKLWKLQQQQFEAADAAQSAQEDEKSNSDQEKALEEIILEIGECNGISLSKSLNELMISGRDFFWIFSGERWRNKIFDIRTEFQLLKAIFETNEKQIFALGQDGTLRVIDWKNLEKNNISFIKEDEIQGAVGTKDGKYFAILSNNQSCIRLYSYVDCSVIDTFQHGLDYTYLMNFSADSSALVCVQGTDYAKTFNIILIKIGAGFQEKVVSIPNLRITEDYITQVDASLTKKEIYIVSKSETSSSLHIYGFDRKCKKTIRDISALSVSSDEKILAYSNNSNKLHMIFIKEQQKDQVQQNRRNTNQRKSTKVKQEEILQATPTDEKTINTINLSENAISLEFYDNNMKIAVQTPSFIIGYDVYTHEVLFKIQTSSSKLQIKRMRILYDQFLTFTDIAQRVQVYDLNYYLKTDYINLSTKPLNKLQLQVNPAITIEHTAWANCGNHLILQMKDKLLFQASPFNHHRICNELVHQEIFENIQGLYVPILIGGPKLGSGTFAELYNVAIKKDEEDQTLLATPIYPYKLNALHYFAMTSNLAGAQFCFENRVKFMQDCFGKSPLDYAIQTKDKLIIDIIMSGIYETDAEERTRILRTLPLSLLVEHPTSCLPNLLSQAGSTVPKESKFGDGLTIPTLYPIKKMGFAESGVPLYSAEVARVLHNPNLQKSKKARNRPISTLVLNNPLPKNFTEDSMKLLGAIVDCSNDDIVRCKPITLFLNRKWNAYAYKFYLFQFIMFITLLLSLSGLDVYKTNTIIKWPCFLISLGINTYFFMFELLQLAIQRLEYFQSFNNLLDLSRLAVIYMFQISVFYPDVALPDYVLPAVFMLMWFKILSYLSVFKPTRYLIKMTFEIINDITTFLIILFSALIAYAQINYVIYQDDIVKQIRDSYVLSFGELVGWDEIGNLQFILFIIFSFFIPLVLMNMLIALMADSYTRVQTNAVAADARALAEMEMEMEEVVQFILNIFRPSMIKEEFYYCFTTQVNDGEEEEDWEGTVGQLKRTIEEATETLQGNLLNAVDELTKRNTEKIIDNLLKANKQELDVIDAINTLVQKENNNLRQHIEEKLLDESHKMKEQFSNTHKKMELQQKKVEEEFKNTTEKLDNEMNNVKEEFKRTHEKMDKESQKVEDEFQKTHAKITQDTLEMKNDIQKAQEKIEQESQQMQQEIKKASDKVEQESSQMKSELKKAHEMITDVNSQVQTTSSKIVENVQQTTSQTQEALIKKIEVTNEDGTTKVKQQVDVQTGHHKEMVTFAVDTQKKVTELLTKTAEEQIRLLGLVDELKQVQTKSLESITNSEQELQRKKEFETQQQDAVKKIEALLNDLQTNEKQKSVKNEEEKKEREQKDQVLRDELKKIQDELEKIQKKEEDRKLKEDEGFKKHEESEKEIKDELKKIQEELGNLNTMKDKKEESKEEKITK